jgi:hypothetical protein
MFGVSRLIMRFYCVNEPNFDREGNIISNDVRVYSEQEIIDEYWDYWCKMMKELHGEKVTLIRGDCIEDWIAVNWAWESKDD